MDYKKKYEQALERARTMIKVAANQDEAIGFANTIFPELKESEDEKIRKDIIRVFTGEIGFTTKEEAKKYIAWLEKQVHDGKKWIYEDVYLKEREQLFQDGINEVLENPQKYGLEKQGGITKLSEEEQNKFAKGVLTSCALSFINYLDAHAYEGKMCVSNGECVDIENAFHNAMWDRLHRYYCKYIEKQGEQKADKCEGCNNVKGCITCTDGDQYAHIKEYNPAWSEEDEKILQTLINDTEKTLFAIKQEERPDIMSGLSEIYIERLRWLKSLKERIKGE